MRCAAGLSFLTLALVGAAAAAADIDVTFIDRLPNYAYDASKNAPDAGDPVTFVGHVKLDAGGPMEAPYTWYLDGLTLASGMTTLLPGADNTISVPWTWDPSRHEIMLVVNPEGTHLEASDQNNILFDFTNGLIVGVAVEQGLVDVFSRYQDSLGIGSQGFEDWFQRMIRIWNLMLMADASDLMNPGTLEVQDRVRGVLSYHPDGTLLGGNCPLIWKDVDMLWGKLTSDIAWYDTQT